ncbi:(5-formylfuran-3-yl)methyl phosphate synthase [Methylococcus capsulatus]|uniref:(5-formylfuran-3-yl)methyl phosphate synthase n=1 Tax=Methylococcus capsulatus TaxID=414 RepID=UPI001C52E572|nr:(5-formylfuran-3-yl)methyl phosphate synthase [Methylococcus capsulatus]QXP88035.1 (5-formylfuran-3-yl)methyl phosphate synthase [Methylococcus capsulatus]QXP94953.1 (5-formylfuran-3-yl)methyl phosphate synthase [Methylococcus capsulatus]UQN13063.1 (5-formylfuran-3-yl)methyl phosphate synthase [Methylococcus capsulatus]
MTGMLASVRNLTEARIALEAGVDIVDLKAPEYGSLGALPADEVGRIVAELEGTVPVSATIGDLPLEPDPICRAVREMADTGVDYVKIGMFRGGDWSSTLAALAQLASHGTRLVAVLFADNLPDFDWIARLKKAGFAGAMLDTQDKDSGPLTEILDRAVLERFVGETRAQSLLCGLAGSLRSQDVPGLLSLEPDYLGFRGALCHGARRAAGIDPEALTDVRRLIPSAPPRPFSSQAS